MQPAYSPDLSPSDFFLFGYLKQQVQEAHILDQESLKSEIIPIFSGIAPSVLISMFKHWTKRLE
jgi:hypothetical protein